MSLLTNRNIVTQYIKSSNKKNYGKWEYQKSELEYLRNEIRELRKVLDMKEKVTSELKT